MQYIEYRSDLNMRWPGAAHSVAQKHHKLKIQLGSSYSVSGIAGARVPALKNRITGLRLKLVWSVGTVA
ncbi:hypothetical protein T265_06675 [Opisthorchis viverrini]|uniref:Uncharacterized protein n=1 Tax=Opisthorchis viverrini TaxID=6198 RepID=A0A074ZRK3_OPIVI|nr:hypothetical protein T265_06675 [Opisthorchis viverrini]KER25980.1 hypothetical protein T265_06675 [Opisthorchis viverrini]